MIKEVLYLDEDVFLSRYFDSSAGVWVLSVEVYNWSLSKAKKWFKVMEEVVGSSNEYYYSYVKDEKAKKFNEMFGFTSTGTKVVVDGTEYEVMYV